MGPPSIFYFRYVFLGKHKSAKVCFFAGDMGATLKPNITWDVGGCSSLFLQKHKKRTFCFPETIFFIFWFWEFISRTFPFIVIKLAFPKKKWA
jgi:hypothetical protein